MFSNIIPRSVAILFLSLSFVGTQTSWAAKPVSGPGPLVVWPADSSLVISPQNPYNQLTWMLGSDGSSDFDGLKVFGYDVHYSAANPPTTADNNTRIETGANNGSWLDVLDGVELRCAAANYWIQAYDRGRKTYSMMLPAISGDTHCEGSGGGGGGGGGNSLVVNDTGSVDFFVGTPYAGSSAVPTNWEMFAAEEFSLGTTLDKLTSPGELQFYTAQPWGADAITNGESQYYLDEANGASATDSAGNNWSPFQFVADSAADEGYLVIQAGKLLEDTATGSTWLSGLLSTHPGTTVDGIGSFSPPFYFETRARMPRGKGLYPAIWFLDYNLSGGNEELDVIEYIGQSCLDESTTRRCNSWSTPEFGASTWETQYHTYHDSRGGMYQTWTNSTLEQGMSDDWNWWLNEVPDFSNEFHTYGLKYTKEEVVWYIDGIQVMRIRPGRGKEDRKDDFYVRRFPTSSMYLVLNVAFDVTWFTQKSDFTTIDHTTLGGRNDVSMMIDYVRFYKP